MPQRAITTSSEKLKEFLCVIHVENLILRKRY